MKNDVKNELAVMKERKEQLANLTVDTMNTLFKNSSSGLENVQETNVNVRPKELKVVQKLTGESMFEVPFDRKDIGKIFAKPEKTKDNDGSWKYLPEDKLKESDLYEIYSATLLKVEFGVEIWRKEKRDGSDFDSRTVYARSKNTIKPDERGAWLSVHNPDDNPNGYKYTNMIKLLMTPYTQEEVAEMMAVGKNPFVSIQLNGKDGWNTWGVLVKRMTELKRELGIKTKLSDMLSSLFTLNIKAVKIGQYYQFDISVKLNDVQEALKFTELVNMLDTDFTFFYNTNNMDITLRDSGVRSEKEVIDSTFKNEEGAVEQVEVDENGEVKTNLEDLPF